MSAIWEELAATLGPQSAPYMFDESWFEGGEFLLRSVKCECGALVEIIDEGEAVPPGEYLCDACTLRLAFTGETTPIGIGKYIKGGQ